MDQSRRGFLKIAGVSVLGVGWGAPVFSALARAIKTEASPNGLEAARWAMLVDIKRCHEKPECRACIEACHLAHNVPEIRSPEEEIKWIWKEPYQNAFPNQVHQYTEEALRGSPVMVLCNHCDNPPCVRVCPTQATYKREDGIVMMDQHRCVGCRYCLVACPYGARSFNWSDPRPFIKEVRREFPTRTKGVVEKCNFCAERLAQGLAPACVEACRQVARLGALKFGDLGDRSSEVSRILRRQHSLRRKPGLGTEPHVFYLV